MDKALRIQPIWNDIDVVLIRVTVWNGEFGGASEIYVAHGALHEAAGLLSGFPKNTSDSQTLQFGTFGNKYAGGAVSMVLSADSAGHVVVSIEIESDHSNAGIAQSARLVFRTEAAAVDEFVRGLQQVESDLEGTAELKGVP